MDYSEVLAKAKETIGPNCKVCPECNGLACGHTLPAGSDCLLWRQNGRYDYRERKKY